MALRETNYIVTVEERNGKKHVVEIKGEDIDEWVEICVIRKLYHPEAQLYYISGTNDSPIHGIAFYTDPTCKCQKTLSGHLTIAVKEMIE